MTRAREIANVLGRKNAIINGNFYVWQRGLSFAAITSNTYHADRWRWHKGGVGVTTVSRSTNLPDNASGYSLSTQVTTPDASVSGGDYYIHQYLVEGYDMQRFGFGNSNAQQATLSFWVRSAVTGIHCVALRNSSHARSYVAEYTVDVADTWEYKTITIPGDTTGTWNTDNTVGVRIAFNLGSGAAVHGTADTWTAGNLLATSNQVNVMGTTSNVFALSSVQLEVGSAATEFEHRTINEELALCQRYYEKSYNLTTPPGTFPNSIGSNRTYATGINNAIHSIGQSVEFKTRKRTTPTMVSYSPQTGAAGFVYDYGAGQLAANLISVGESSFMWIGTSAGALSTYNLDMHWTADAEL